ncbi:MAG: hypothetical protein HYR86_02240 [Candidatus Rokubacteria bacterium]|nr:hypothetical protein [Candidatus Rokubacteria bacterium]
MAARAVYHLDGMTEEWRRLHVLNYEMESSTLLTFCRAENLRLGEDHAVLVGIKAMEILARSRMGEAERAGASVPPGGAR